MLWMVLREALLLAAAGVGIGVLVAFVGGRVAVSAIPGLLFELGATDPVILLSAASLLFVVAGLAAYIPARRAAGIQPMEVLRQE